MFSRLRIGTYLFCLMVVGAFTISAPAINTENEGYQLLNLTNSDINVHNNCKNVANTSGRSQFISTRTAAQWENFIANAPSGLSLSSCTLDPNWSSVVLLIQPTSEDTSIEDYSLSNHTVTPGDNAVLSTAVSDPWGGTRKVILFDGSNDELQMPDSDDWHFASGNFTIEFWLYFLTLGASTNHQLYSQFQNSNNNLGIAISNHINDGLSVYANSGGTNIIYIDKASDTILATGAWHHVAITRQGNTFRAFLNGVQHWSGSDASAWPNLSATMGLLWNFHGYMGGARITKGVARYTSGFTPSTVPWAVTKP